MELADVEADLEDLLQRQSQLSNRKHELESIINRNQSNLTRDDKNWDLTGRFVYDLSQMNTCQKISIIIYITRKHKNL